MQGNFIKPTKKLASNNNVDDDGRKHDGHNECERGGLLIGWQCPWADVVDGGRMNEGVKE